MCVLSVVMPVYNAQEYLDEKLQLICEHLSEKIELIVVNDGSIDGSLQICHNRLADRENTVIVSQDNQGLSCARNRGIREAQGEYILFLDCDDGLVFESIEEILEALIRQKPDVLMGRYLLHSPTGISLPKSYDFLEETNDPLSYIYHEVPDSIWNVWRYICKRTFLMKHALWFTPGILCEDVDWTPRMLDKAEYFSFFSRPFYVYFYRADSITHTVSFKKTLNLNRTIENNFAVYRNKAYQSYLYRRLIRESFYSMSDYYLFSKEQRRMLNDIIHSMSGCYRRYGAPPAKLFSYTQSIIPIFVWSYSLDVARKARRIIRRLFAHLYEDKVQ